MSLRTPFMTPEKSVVIAVGDVALEGDLALPASPRGLVLFVHGSGSSRRSSRNRAVAATLQQRGFATLLFDLLTEAEDRTVANRFDIPLLTRRLLDVTAWARRQPGLGDLPVGYFGASTGAAAALEAAAASGNRIAAVVSRGGRPDLALSSLPRVRAATQFIVGGADPPVLDWNRDAFAHLHCTKALVVVPGATHLFEEPGALAQVAQHAGEWLSSHCRPARQASQTATV